LRGDNQITLSNGAIVQAATAGSGSGAGVTISTAATGMIRVDASTLTVGSAGSGSGGPLSVQTGQLTLSNGGAFVSIAQAGGSGSPIAINAETVVADGGLAFNLSTGIFSTTSSTASNAGRGGAISIVAGELVLHNSANVLAGSCAARTCGPLASSALPPAGAGGGVVVSVGSLTVDSGSSLGTVARGIGDAGNVTVMVGGSATIDRGVSAPFSILDGVGSTIFGKGNAGNVSFSAGALTITNDGEVASTTFTAASAAGNSGSVFVDVAGTLSIDGSGGFPNTRTGILGDTHSAGRGGDVTVIADGITIGEFGYIASDVASPGSGHGGNVTVTANNVRIADSGQISSSTFAGGDSGNVSIKVADGLTIDGGGLATGIFSQVNTGSTRNAGTVSVSAGSISIINNGQIAGNTRGPGNGGSISIDVASGLMIDGAMTPGLVTGIASQANIGSTGNAGPISVSAGSISLANRGRISSQTLGTGSAGQITVAAGTLSIASNGQIAGAAGTGSSGKGGNIVVTVAGQLLIEGTQGDLNTLTGISTQSQGSGDAGSVSVKAGTLSINHISAISSSTFASGKGGTVAVAVDGLLAIDGSGTNPDVASGIATNSLAGSSGNAGDVSIQVGALSIVNGGSISSALRPLMNLPASTGNSGRVAVDVGGLLSLSGSGSRIGTETNSGSIGDAGSIKVNAGQIALANGGQIISTTAGTGAGGSVTVTTPGTLVLDGMGNPNTEIAASATGPQSGPAGSVTVQAGSLTVEGGAHIASSTAGPGKGGDVGVTVADSVTLSGSGPNSDGGISAAALPGSSGAAGQVVLTAGGAIALMGGAEVTSSTAGAGRGGSVQVTAGGLLSLTDPASGIVASANSTASGNAGSVIVMAPQITIASGAEIASTTAGTGAGGSVSVTTPGALVIDGAGVANTQIAASAIGSQSGPGGSVTVSANSLTVKGGAEIASSTAGPGKGGDVNITVASDIVLPDLGPQITARSTGGGDAGSITVSAVRLRMSNGAEISTEAVGERSAASGGNITLHVRDFLYLVSSEITTSVKGRTGDGGNIRIDPQLVILNHSSIKAEAIEGHGGNITITAGEFIRSSDSIVSATSQLGISGTIEINGTRVDVNGALVVLSSELRGRTEVLREACAARADQPISSLVEAGRGGLPQDPEATLPALYIAGRDVNPNPRAAGDSTDVSTALPTTVHLTMRCG